jgi:hypothetical protein
MAYKSVNIFLSDWFDYSFNYPTGITILNDEIYIVDSQNHLVKVFDLSGVFQRQFSSTLSYPENITTDGTYLYISDWANHRIVQLDSTGSVINTFGSIGTGNSNFTYPRGIYYKDGLLYIADTQNSRIKIHQTDGTFIAEITGLNFPEGVTVIDENIVVSNSGDKNLKFYDINTLNLLLTTTIDFEYPTQVKETDGILTVCDKQANRLVFIDSDGNYIDESLTALNFPSDIVYYDGYLYVPNYSTQLVRIFEFTVTDSYPKYAQRLLKLTKQLYPIARAWIMRKDSIFEKIHEALAYSESRVRQTIEEIRYSLIPDNDVFSDADATNWERALGLYNQSVVSLATRKETIYRKMRHPGTILGRQNYLYIQGQLQAAGFDCYVHENRFGDPPAIYEFISAIYNEVRYGEVVYGYDGGSFADFQPVANYIDETKDAGYDPGNAQHQRYLFFIGGASFPDPAPIQQERRAEFRELILRLKPAHTAVGLLLADYVPFDGIGYDIIEDTLQIA